jgi:hypothetical protein
MPHDSHGSDICRVLNARGPPCSFRTRVIDEYTNSNNHGIPLTAVLQKTPNGDVIIALVEIIDSLGERQPMSPVVVVTLYQISGFLTH